MWRVQSRRGWLAVAFFAGWLALAAAVGGPIGDAKWALAAPDARAELEPVDVALDPGHSSWDVGATGAGLAEYNLTLDVANRVRAQLEESRYTVRLTRTDSSRVAPSVPRDSTEAIRVEQEARIAAAGPASVYVSIHFNAHPNRSLRGTETYFNGDNFRAESVRLGTLIQDDLLGSLRHVGYESTDRGVREDLTAGKPYGHFFSLRGPFPSVLVESLFLSNPVEAEMLHQDGVRAAIASGIAQGISRYLAEKLGVAGGAKA
jgi:N-acetylmuramoyl-L-alanine amidase